MAKRQKRKQNRLIAFFTGKSHLLPALITVVFVAALGTYWVVQSFAATPCTTGARTNINNWGTLSPSTAATPGTTYSYSWHISITDYGSGDGCLPFTLSWHFSSDFSYYQTVPATINTPTGGSYTVSGVAGNEKDVSVSFTARDPLGCPPYITIHVTATDRYGNALPGMDNSISTPAAATCVGNDTPGDPAGDPPGDPAGDPPGDPPGDNPGVPPGDGAAPNNTKQSSANNNSPTPSATKQSNKSNTVPSSTAQGTGNVQASIEPTPFFDGKLFTTGSSAKKVFDPSVSFAGKKISGWSLYIVSLLLVTGIVGFLWWWRRVQRQSRKR